MITNIRTERADDFEAVFSLHAAAFGNREDESRLVENIRLSDCFVQELSLVAEERRRIVGHALFSKAEVVDEDRKHEVIVLAPIAVMPDFQRKGIGGKLIQEGIRRCTELGFPYIFLIGHPTYYPKFGFAPARQFGFELKQYEVPDEVFMVQHLHVLEGMPAISKGELRYPKSFFM